MNLNNHTIDQLDALQITTLDQLLLDANSGIAVTSSHRLFRNRWFAPRLFAPALWRGVGEEVEVPAHLCGDVALLPHYNARVNTYPKYNAKVQLLPTYNGIVKAREC